MNYSCLNKPLFLFAALTILSSPTMAAPPFIKGQIAVYASPHEISDLNVVKYLPNAGISVVGVKSGKEWGQVQKFRKQGKKAGLNYLAHASARPNDVLYQYQWHFPAVQSEQAWDITKGAGVKVAVLDTGIVSGGNDGINLCTSGAYDIVNDDGNPSDGSELSHGTHVAGTIAQITSFDQTTPTAGVAGLAPSACVMPIKVLDDTGSGSFADIAEGIFHAINHGAQVINMSLSVDARSRMTSDPLIDPALDAAYQSDVTVVAATGNDGHRKNVGYPAIYPSVIAVAATDYRNKLTRYSNRGTGLDIVAPGGDTARDDNNDGNSDGVLQETYYQGAWNYYLLQGTSMASPHVAATAALLISNGITRPDDVIAALSNTAKDLGNAGYDSSYGHGLIQAYDALNDGGGVPLGPPQSASGPYPNDDAIGVSIDSTLSWVAGTDAISHKVYFGTDTLEYLGEVGVTLYEPGLLNPDTLYQWQIIEVNSIGETPGPIWRFTTDTTTQCTDADGDGFCVSDGDCDDGDSQVYPGHQDSRGKWGRNGVDNDCNGIIDG
jgi:serine protease